MNNGYAQAEQLFVRGNYTIVISSNGNSLDDGPIDIAVFSGREVDQSKWLAGYLNAHSVEQAFEKTIKELRKKGLV